ncbi:hypothetical protein L486_05739 [Kwoniella mangroviensis CBS 10435]|uniref:Uncharacterized protein n=1 Tax=Kwoniella mangroviensis CBS 10435 TaxID=1331196 RepID=A0A1B9INE6_9TREE|nr:hypothetical protein L486_05739 [Kwoniella mangroviensis CBS 10435]
MAANLPPGLLEQILRQRAAQAASAGSTQPSYASTFGGGPRTVPLSSLFGNNAGTQPSVPLSSLFGQPQPRPQQAFSTYGGLPTGTGIPSSYLNSTNTNNPFYRPGSGFGYGYPPPPPSVPSNISYGRNGQRFDPSQGFPPPDWFINDTNNTPSGTGWGNIGTGGINTGFGTSTNANSPHSAYWSSALPPTVSRLQNGPTTIGGAFQSYISELKKDAIGTLKGSEQIISQKSQSQEKLSQYISETTTNIMSALSRNANVGGGAVLKALRELEEVRQKQDLVSGEIANERNVKTQAISRVNELLSTEVEFTKGELSKEEALKRSREWGSTYLGRNTNGVTWSTWDDYLTSATGTRSQLNPFLKRNELRNQAQQQQTQGSGSSFFGNGNGSNPFSRFFNRSNPTQAQSGYSGL